MSTHNGTPPAPHVATRGAAPRQPTEFLPEFPIDGWLLRCYVFGRARLFGLALVRWLYLLLIGIALLWALLPLSGGWPLSLFWLALAGACWLVMRTAHRRSFIAFQPQSHTPPLARSMTPAQKMPCYVTGLLSVEQKVRHFTALPGFYRSFATREHALLCRVQTRRIWGVATWPEEEVGLWYAFFTSAQVVAIVQGALRTAAEPLPALAITYRPAPPVVGRQRGQPAPITLYLAFLNAEACATVLADLLIEWPAASRSA